MKKLKELQPVPRNGAAGRQVSGGGQRVFDDQDDPSDAHSPSAAQMFSRMTRAGGGSIIAKRRDLPFQAGSRDGMQKIKRHRSADCVIGGFRNGKRAVVGRKLVGSLLLGLYASKGKLLRRQLRREKKSTLTERPKALPRTTA